MQNQQSIQAISSSTEVIATLEVASNCCHVLFQLNLALRIFLSYMPQQAETTITKPGTN